MVIDSLSVKYILLDVIEPMVILALILEANIELFHRQRIYFSSDASIRYPWQLKLPSLYFLTYYLTSVPLTIINRFA